MPDRQRELHQFFTPLWIAEALVERYFGALNGQDLVLEPSCGTGAFLSALGPNIPAVGVEIDPELAAATRAATGRNVICGDFRCVQLDIQPTAVVGNPPFDAAVFDGMLQRCHALLPDGAPAGFILPAYMMQTPSRVCRYLDQWSLTSELLPRTIWPRLSKPLVFCLFRKGKARVMVGFALYQECRDVEALRPEYRELIRGVSGSAWATAVGEALANLGGESDLDSIYRAMEPNRPTGNRWWKEKVRQVLQQKPFRRTDRGRYALAVAA